MRNTNNLWFSEFCAVKARYVEALAGVEGNGCVGHDHEHFVVDKVSHGDDVRGDFRTKWFGIEVENFKSVCFVVLVNKDHVVEP